MEMLHHASMGRGIAMLGHSRALNTRALQLYSCTRRGISLGPEYVLYSSLGVEKFNCFGVYGQRWTLDTAKVAGA